MSVLVDEVIKDIYDNWEGKNRLTLSKTSSLIELCSLNASVDYYVKHQLLSYPYDQVDCEDLHGLEWHIKHYYDMFKES